MGDVPARDPAADHARRCVGRAARLRTVDRRLRDHELQLGSTITFPLFIWGAARVAIPPQIYVIATMIFLFTVAVMIITVGSSGAPRGWRPCGPTSRRPRRGAGPGLTSRRADRGLRARAKSPMCTRARASCTRRAGSSPRGVPMSWMSMWTGGFPSTWRSAHGSTVIDVDGHDTPTSALATRVRWRDTRPEPHAVAHSGGITTMLPTADGAWVGGELRVASGCRSGSSR